MQIIKYQIFGLIGLVVECFDHQVLNVAHIRMLFS